jgi:hypothetical protein
MKCIQNLTNKSPGEWPHGIPSKRLKCIWETDYEDGV